MSCNGNAWGIHPIGGARFFVRGYPIKFLLDIPAEGVYTKNKEWMPVLGIVRMMGKQSLA